MIIYRKSKNSHQLKDSNKYKLRNDIYKCVIEEFDKITKLFFSKIHEDFNRNVLCFINSLHEQWTKGNNSDLREIIPVGIMMLGVNSDDHMGALASLAESVASSPDNVPVRLSGNSCSSLKKAIDRIVTHVIPENELAKLNLPNSLKTSFIAFDEWLKKQNKLKQIVVIIDNVESFNEKILQDLIEITSKRHVNCPFMFLLGISSNMECLNGLLNNRHLSINSTEYFSCKSPLELLNSFLSLLMTRGFPFIFGHRLYLRVVKYLFEQLDCSISQLLLRIKFILHEHIYHHASIDQSIHLLSNSVDYSEHQLQFDQWRSSIPGLIKVGKYQQLFVQIADWLLDLFARFPETKLGTQFHQLLEVHLQTGLGNSQQLTSNLILLRSLTKEELIEIVTRANSKLSTEKENNSLLSDFIENSEKSLKNSQSIQPHSTPKNLLLSKNKKLNNEIQEILIKEKKPRKKDSYDEFFSWLHNWLSNNLPHYRSLPDEYPKWLYMDNVEEFEENVNPSIRIVQNRCLRNPFSYLIDDSRLRLDSIGSISGSLPDTCIAYKLHLEYPRLVNLYDWLQAFSQIIDPSDSEEHVPSLLTQCRFNKSVAELEFMGYVKRTKAKADHMIKTTWGAVF